MEPASQTETLTMNLQTASAAPLPPAELKRKRSPSGEAHAPPAPPPKTQKTTSNHLQINYLARQDNEDLPLVSGDDTLPSIIHILERYQGVLDRHESMACNLGARPLGPILIKKFERLFDGPPKVLKNHGKDGNTVTWLDVVEFARNKPEQFALGQMSEGQRVCQFYTKQCRVQISEEDFMLISSGIPFKLIPPQPIVEDEEKELGTIEILEKHLTQICQLADSVAARTRQLNHRLKSRKQAILDRRATDNPPAVRASSPSTLALMNGLGATAMLTQNSTPGFVAVNSRPPEVNGGATASPETHHTSSSSHSHSSHSHSHTHSHSHSHSHSSHTHRNGASPATRTELLSKFFTLSDKRSQSSTSANGDLRHPSIGPTQTTTTNTAPATSSKPKSGDYSEWTAHHANTSPVPIPHTPSSLLPQHQPTSRSAPQEKDDGGPFKAEMVARMEGLAKGERVMPPCDRCRRLHMDCLKNLTACQGCTKKHAKCSWKEVKESELRPSYQAGAVATTPTSSNAYGSGYSGAANAAANALQLPDSGRLAPATFDDLDDEPASVGQRTPPQRHTFTPATAAGTQYGYQQVQQSPAQQTTQSVSGVTRDQISAPTASMDAQPKLEGDRHAADVEEQLKRAARLAEEEQARQEAERQKREHEQYESRLREFEASQQQGVQPQQAQAQQVN